MHLTHELHFSDPFSEAESVLHAIYYAATFPTSTNNRDQWTSKMADCYREHVYVFFKWREWDIFPALNKI